MRFGVNRWTLPAEWDVELCFAAAREAGFEGIELNVAEEGCLTTATDTGAVARIRDAAGRAGIALTSLSTGLGWKYPLSSLDDSVRSQGIACLRAGLRIARDLGVDAVLCVPGVVDAGTPYDLAWERSLSAIRSVTPEAESLGVSIAIENVWNRFLLSPLEMARFIDDAGSQAARAYFDVGNVLAYGFPQHWIRILGSRIARVHVKDYRTSVGTGAGFANPLQGDVPWAEVRDALCAVGYDGWIIAEVAGYPNRPELGLRHVAESLREIFARPLTPSQ